MVSGFNISFLCSIFLLSFISAKAQTYALVPNDSIVLEGALDRLETLSIQQKNISKDTLYLKWFKIFESVPSSWEASVCDNSFCNETLVDSGTMLPVLPDKYGLLLIHITPHQNLGKAIVQYVVYDNVNPQFKDTLTYILTANSYSGIAENFTKNTFKIYPNPARESIHITSNFVDEFQYKIYDVLGKNYLNGNGNSSTISVIDLPNGIYFIHLISKNNLLGTQNILIHK